MSDSSVLPVLLALAALAACQTESAGESWRERANVRSAEGRGLVATSSQEPDSPAESAGEESEDRLLIHQAELALEVARADEAISRCVQRVKELGGHLSLRENRTVTVRLPAAGFEAFVAELRGYGRVLSEVIRAEDVTQEHRDLTLRLANARKARERLLALLERAAAVEDILAIEKELTRLTTEIEQMQAELAQLDQQVAMATVTVRFQDVAAIAEPRQTLPSAFWWIEQVGVDRVRSHF